MHKPDAELMRGVSRRSTGGNSLLFQILPIVLNSKDF
jgi:hypothetical protein